MDIFWSLTPLLLVISVTLVNGRESIFADLTVEEYNGVTTYLEQQTDLQLISHSLAKVKDSYVFLIEAYRPYKVKALKHLEEGAEAPVRAARVIIYRGDLSPPVVQEYRVSPIPNPEMHEKLIYENWRDPIPFNSRPPYNPPQESLFEALFIREFAHIDGVIRHATDGYTYGTNCTKKCLRWFPAMPAQSEADHHKVTAYMVRDFDGGYLHPIGLQFVINMESLDESEWEIEKIWFRGQRFASFNQMGQKLSVSIDDVEVVHDHADVGTPQMSSSMNFRGEPRPTEAKRGPATYYPDGARYSVDGNHIEWLGWEFDFGMLASSGLQLHDVKFLEERIVYELALQEIGVFYGGGSPVASHTNYYDSSFIFGLNTAQMFPGHDCPAHAEFFDFVHYMHGKPMIFKNGACVFERDNMIPLRKHFETDLKSKAGYKWAQGMSDNVLVFRHMLTVLNYDYVIDVIFHQGGQVEVSLSLTGYVLPTFYTGSEMDKYGHRLNDAHAIGNVHHHVANWKVDMDIKGLANRFETLNVVLEDQQDDLTPGMTLKNRKVVNDLKHREMDAAYQFNFDHPKYLVMYNEESKNRFGDHRGYRILSEGMSKMLLPDDYRGLRSRAWTKYQVAVTKHKESERCSSSIYTAIEPFNPVMSFDDFIKDDEKIVDEDLVLWLTLGTHHIPHTEDIPVVNTPGVQLKFFLLPYNYFDEDPSLASRDNVRVTPDKDNNPRFEYSGVPPPPDGPKDPTSDAVYSTSGSSMTKQVLSCLAISLYLSLCRCFA